VRWILGDEESGGRYAGWELHWEIRLSLMMKGVITL
jgi:hypothetical protein